MKAKTFEAVRKDLRGLAEDITVFLYVSTSDHSKPGQLYLSDYWTASISLDAEGIDFRIEGAADAATLLKRAKAKLAAERKAKAARLRLEHKPKQITHQPKLLTHQPIGKGSP